jgi:hypothetical protein
MIADILLVEPKNLSLIINSLNYYFFELVGLFVALALVLELISDGDGLSVVKRAMAGLLIISVAAIVQSRLTHYSFELADKGYTEVTSGRPTFFGGSNAKTLFSEYKRSLKAHERGETEPKGFFGAAIDYARFAGSIVMAPVQNSVDTFLVYATRVVIIFCFIFIKVTYTAIFIMNLFLLPFPALVSILPFSKNSATLPISTILWLIIHPFTVTSILFCMDVMLADAVLSSTKQGSGIDFETCIMLLCFSVILIGSTGITAAIISGTGITQAVAQSSLIVPLKALAVGKMAAAVATKGLTSAASFAGSGRLMNLGANVAQMSSSKLAQGGGGGLKGTALKGLGALGTSTEKIGRGFHSMGNAFKEKKGIVADTCDLEKDSYCDKYLDSRDPSAKAYGIYPSDSSARRPSSSSGSFSFTTGASLPVDNAQDLSKRVNSIINRSKSSGSGSVHADIASEIKKNQSPSQLNSFADEHEKRIPNARSKEMQGLLKKEANLARNRARLLENKSNTQQGQYT